MILVDSSAWIDYDRGSRSPAHLHLARLVNQGADVAVTEPVLMEVLAGCKSWGAAETLRSVLTSFTWTPCDPVADFEGAAQIYRECRATGITPRNLVDCIIASIAMRTDAELLTADRDFELMATVVPLRLAVT